MNKLVYLYELDSVRQTDCEIVLGQQAMHDEIVKNGNTVVLTYNQLVDSRGFFSLFNDKGADGEPEYFNNIVSLFECGALRLSQYSDVRTVSQYILNALSRNKKFIFSALPIQGDQRRLIALIERTLHYSDLSEIHAYIEKREASPDEIAALFEYTNENNEPEPSPLAIGEMCEILENLYYLLALILRISPMHDIYIPPRDTREYENLALHNIIETALTLKCDSALWNSASSIIKGTALIEKKCNDRSVYLREILKMSDAAGRDLAPYRYAEAIVDLCYNYTCEISIANSSKHYDFSELIDPCSEKPSFSTDFFTRLERDFGAPDQDMRYLRRETNEFDQFKNAKKRVKHLSDAVRIAKSKTRLKKRGADTEPPKETHQYEDSFDSERRIHKLNISLSALKSILYGVTCMLALLAVDLVLNFIEDSLGSLSPKNEILRLIHGIGMVFSFLVLSELITTLLSKIRFFRLLFIPLSDAVKNIIHAIKDCFIVLFSRSQAYKNARCDAESVKITEPRNKETPIKHITPQRLKDYKKFRYTDPSADDGGDMIPKLKLIPVAPARSSNDMREIIRIEEITDNEYGIIYQSPYNTFTVDPVIGKNGRIYPYERIIPTNGSGVAVLTMCRGKFVLLKQERHAIRRSQLAFVRGFREPNTTDRENVERELCEELAADVLKISDEPIGYITPDSGLTSARVAIFAAEIAPEYKIQEGNEGIKEVLEYSEEELEKMVEDEELDDSFTLAALLFYQRKKGSIKGFDAPV